MRKIQFISLLAGLFGTVYGYAGTYSITPLAMAASDLKKVRTYYDTHKEITVETNYMAFDEHEVSNLRESKNGLYIKSASAYYTKIMNMEIAAIGDEIISVDHEDKQIIIGDNEKIESTIFSNN